MKKIISIAAIAVLLTACGGGSSTSGGSSTTSFLVKNMQGGTTDLVGAWKDTCASSSNSAGTPLPDIIISDTFSGSTITEIETSYTSTDGSCTGTATETGKLTATLALGSDITASGGWEGATGAIAAPTAQDGVTTLPATPSATQVLLSNIITSGSFTAPASGTSSFALAIDASVSNKITSYDVYDNGTGSIIADTFFSMTKQ